MHATLFASPEGRMLGAGLTLTGLMLRAFGVGWQLYPDRILPYAIMTGLNLIIGREAGMSFVYASGFGHPSPAVSGDDAGDAGGVAGVGGSGWLSGRTDEMAVRPAIILARAD